MELKIKGMNGRNPLKSGHRCNPKLSKKPLRKERRRNPLKSGHRCNPERMP